MELATAGYGPAGELLSFNDERRDYNQMLQMTRGSAPDARERGRN